MSDMATAEDFLLRILCC